MRKGDLALRIAATAAVAEFAREYEDPDCIEPLMERLPDAPEVRREAAWGLNFLHDPRSFEPLRDALFLPDVDSPILDFSHPKPETAQRAVAGALAGLNDERAAGEFLRLLEVENSTGRVEALAGLVRLRDPRVLPYFDSRLESDWSFPFGTVCTIAGKVYPPDVLRREVMEVIREMRSGQV